MNKINPNSWYRKQIKIIEMNQMGYLVYLCMSPYLDCFMALAKKGKTKIWDDGSWSSLFDKVKEHENG